MDTMELAGKMVLDAERMAEEASKVLQTLPPQTGVHPLAAAVVEFEHDLAELRERKRKQDELLGL